MLLLMLNWLYHTEMDFSGEGQAPSPDPTFFYTLIQTHLKTKLLASLQIVNYNPTDANFTNPCSRASSSALT